MISPDADPPVCRLIDYSKYKYDQARLRRTPQRPFARRLTRPRALQAIKAKEAQKKMAAGRQEIKELKMRCVAPLRPPTAAASADVSPQRFLLSPPPPQV